MLEHSALELMLLIVFDRRPLVKMAKQVASKIVLDYMRLLLQLILWYNVGQRASSSMIHFVEFLIIVKLMI